MATSDLAEYVRTMVIGDAEGNLRVEQKLDAEGWIGAQVFFASCFYLAVRRKFERQADSGEIIRFVAEIRAWLGDDASEFDPIMAERLIGSVVDRSVDIDISALDQDMVGRVELGVVYTILSQLKMSESELDEFFLRATRMATAD